MTITLTSTGVTIQTLEEIFDERLADLATRLSLTTSQQAYIKTEPTDPLGTLLWIDAEREALQQQIILELYESLGREQTGAGLDRIGRINGIERDAAVLAVVQGTATGAAGEFPNGAALSFDDDGSTWTVIGGTDEIDPGVFGYTNPGSGVTINIQSTLSTTPYPGASSDWTISSAFAAFTGFESTSQITAAREVATDAEYQLEMDVEIFARGSGPVAAMEAALLDVEGVTYARVYENTADITDPITGILAHSVNPVVIGGTVADIRTSLANTAPAGNRVHEVGGSSNTAVVYIRPDAGRSVGFNRVAELRGHLRIELVTSTSEEEVPSTATIETSIDNVLSGYALPVGKDALAYPITSLINSVGLTGIDDIIVTIAVGDPTPGTYAAKQAVDLRQQITFDIANDVDYVYS